MTKSFAVFVLGLVFSIMVGKEGMAGEIKYTLKGRVMDTSDNWLPDARVALKRAGVVTNTDGNGLFTLEFAPAKPLEVDDKKNYDCLEIDKEGYQGRTVEIKDLGYFSRPAEEKLEPVAVGADNVGFSVRMPIAPSIHNLPGSMGIEDKGQPISAESFEKVLTNKEARAAFSGPTERVWFHACVPKGAKKLKAAFLISRHGMGTIDHPVLRRFADENDIALVGILGAPVQRGLCPVSLLDEHIEKLAKMTNHPELATVPVFTFGHSNGTGFATVYASRRPGRVIAWISYHSGWSWQLQFPNLEKTPGLVMHGQKDQWLDHGQEQIVKHLRGARDAPVTMMLEGNVGHGPVNPAATWEFIVEFCKAAMRVRLGEGGQLRPVVIEQGWLGENYDRVKGGQQDLAIAPYDKYAGDRSIANWLPDKQFAEVWRLYGKTDPRTVK
jgi:hypothetical protein